MGRRGPAPKPTKLRILGGNAGKRPLPKNEPRPEAVPESAAADLAPSYLEGEARAEWVRVAPRLAKLGLLTELDETMLALYCQAVANWREAEARVRLVTAPHRAGCPLGQDPESHGHGFENALMQGWVKRAKEERAAARQLAAEFGFSPASRSRVKAAPPDEPEKNPLDEFIGGPRAV